MAHHEREQEGAHNAIYLESQIGERESLRSEAGAAEFAQLAEALGERLDQLGVLGDLKCAVDGENRDQCRGGVRRGCGWWG